MAADQADSGRFSDAEVAAMKNRAAELRAERKAGRGSARRESEAQACSDAIAALTGADRAVAEKLHQIVAEEAPSLDAKTWYGFPSYARDGKVVVFFQPASKFNTRYGTVSFSDQAALDDGDCWPTVFAVVKVTDAVDARLRGLVRRAASASPSSRG